MTSKFDLEITKFSVEDFKRLDNPTPQDRAKQIASYLRVCATILENDSDDRYDSVAWRLADAGLLMRRLIEDTWGEHTKNCVAINEPTGRGAVLPNSDRKP